MRAPHAIALYLIHQSKIILRISYLRQCIGSMPVYSKVETIPAADVQLTLKGDGETANVAEWVKDEYSFSITSTVPVDRYVMAKLIQMIK